MNSLVYTLAQSKQDLQEFKEILFGLGLGLSIASFYALRNYLAGGWCDLTKDLTGKNIVITGGNDGIGKQTAKRLIELNGNIIIGARDDKKNKDTVEELSKLGKGKITYFKLDLSDKQSIENFAKNVNNYLQGQPLQYLLNNAGLFSIPELKKTKQNLQMQIGVNHFGHFYLTYLLWNKLKQSKNPRIVNVSSNSHQSVFKSHDLDMDNLHFQNGGYSSYTAYSHSKKANTLFAKQLQRKMDQSHINGISVSLHPGPVNTGITRQFSSNLTGKILNTLATPFIYLIFKTPIQGAQTNIYCILQDQQKLIKGGYYKDCRPAKTRSPQVEDSQLAERLWVQSQKTFGIKFDL